MLGLDSNGSIRGRIHDFWHMPLDSNVLCFSLGMRNATGLAPPARGGRSFPMCAVPDGRPMVAACGLILLNGDTEMAKLNLNTALVAALSPLCAALVEGSGKLWNNARDAYVIALADFPAGKDAAAAVRQVITDTLKANPGSVKGYLSTLVWLSDNGRDAATIAAMSMADATAARYPKAPKVGEPGYLEHVAKLDKAARDKREAQEREAAEKATPRSRILSEIAAMLAERDEATLSLIAAEIATALAALDAPAEGEPEVAEPVAANG